MITELSTASRRAVTTDAAFAAQRAIRSALSISPSESLLAALSVYRAAGAMGNVYGFSEEQSEALMDERDKVWLLIQRADINSRWDAVAKLELVSETWDIGERLDGSDAAMLRQVICWLRAGGIH